MEKPGDCPDKINCLYPATPVDCTAGYKCVDGIMEKCGKGKWSRAGKMQKNNKA